MVQTKFLGNQAACSGVEDFEGFLPYMGVAAILVMSNIMSSNFHFLVPESFRYHFWFRTAKQFLRKSSLNFCMYTTLGHGQEMTLTFNTHIPS